jgi:ferredoxin
MVHEETEYTTGVPASPQQQGTGKKRPGTLKLPVAVFLCTAALLSVVQGLPTDRPLILLERFVRGGGWIEILAVALYGSFLAYKMQDRARVAKWRRTAWIIFSMVFFLQLFIGLLGAENFLMTGHLHLPIPAMILAGPLYRSELSVMTALFLSTVLLTGSAWCSQLCYFGAFDGMASSGITKKGPLPHKTTVKFTFLFLVIMVAIILRWAGLSVLTVTLIAVGFGLGGVAVMLLFSRRSGKMIHCTLYCPIGTVVSILKPLNPFRLVIDHNCTLCMRCSAWCKYDALNLKDIRNRKPAFTCTLCGDCLAACHERSIQYRFLRLEPEKARYLYLFLTLSLHAVFLALARI